MGIRGTRRAALLVRSVLVVAAVSVAVVGCGGGDDDGDDAAELEDAVRAYTEAFFAPDPDAAYDLLSARCRETIDEEAYTTTLEDGAGRYGELTVESFTVEEMDGGAARVTYGVGEPEIDQQLLAQPWTREEGGWRWDAC